MTEKLRINKFFTHHGICSRREADCLVESGRVTINQRVASLGDKVSPEDVIARDGQVIPWGTAPVYIKYYKPVGVTTTSESHVTRNIIAEIGHPERIFPLGRFGAFCNAWGNMEGDVALQVCLSDAAQLLGEPGILPVA